MAALNQPSTGFTIRQAGVNNEVRCMRALQVRKAGRF